jgi:FtsP/CotA-like multicopper oxidase with cupredoxin domain
MFVVIAAAAPLTGQGRHPSGAGAHAAPAGSELAPVVSNDNREAAGRLRDGVLTLDLRAGSGFLRPGGDSGRVVRIEALGEVGSALSVPAPLIRVPDGTEIVATVRNELTTSLLVHGLCQRGGERCIPLDVPAGTSRSVRFKTGPAGTYNYWATSSGMPLQFRASEDSQMSGAFIVDPPEGAPADRVFVITEWTSLTKAQLRHVASQDDPGAAFIGLRPDVLFLINGRSWPHTERLRYDVADEVRWRVINLSTQVHPMHLHGFYFQVDSRGNGAADEVFPPARKPRVVTQVMQPGSTMTMTWIPERAGNWLFHCHVMTHVSPALHVDGTLKPHEAHGNEHDPGAGMTGMVLGITVAGAADAHDRPERSARPRKLTLIMKSDPHGFGDAPAYGFAMVDGPQSAYSGPPPVPGPTLVLTRGEPVEITLVNRLPEPTAIHWHGMELDSYCDGVHGWSGHGRRITPMIAPGESFVVRFTPPRTGTFMYHTHLHDGRQLASGLYGAMLVIEPGETFDETTDHVLVIGRGGPQPGSPVVLNNQKEPVLVWKAGVRHRIRVINITPDDIVSAALMSGDAPTTWVPITKDGAPVPPDRCAPAPARQLVGVGEIYDFGFDAPKGRRSLWLELKSPAGKWLMQGHVLIR